MWGGGDACVHTWIMFVCFTDQIYRWWYREHGVSQDILCTSCKTITKQCSSAVRAFLGNGFIFYHNLFFFSNHKILLRKIICFQ